MNKYLSEKDLTKLDDSFLNITSDSGGETFIRFNAIEAVKLEGKSFKIFLKSMQFQYNHTTENEAKESFDRTIKMIANSL